METSGGIEDFSSETSIDDSDKSDEDDSWFYKNQTKCL